MSLLGEAIVEAIIIEHGHTALLSRLSDPFWFQALGCVLGMDWHSSGITTSVMGALKKAVNPRSQELGIFISGGKGKHSRKVPDELLSYSERSGLNGADLVRSSRLAAKIDNNVIQDGFQIYLHSFIVSSKGEWAVIQQGMNEHTGMARRYHWHSEKVHSFIEEPHTFIYGENQGQILNLSDKQAGENRTGIMEIIGEKPHIMLPEIQQIIMPSHHQLTAKDVNMKRLGSVIALAHHTQPKDFESMLLLEGVGPRTVQSLALVSEVIYGSPSRFSDPGRFSFAHGGKDGHPFPVPTKVYDKTIGTLRTAVEKAKIGITAKQEALKNLHVMAMALEKNFTPDANAFEKIIDKERTDSYKHGGRTVFGMAQAPASQQLDLFSTDPDK